VRSRNDIVITVAVKVSGHDRTSAGKLIRDRPRWSEIARSIFVFHPGYPFRGSKQHVQIAIAIEVRRMHLFCVFGRQRENLLRTELPEAVCVFVPGYFVVVRRDR